MTDFNYVSTSHEAGNADLNDTSEFAKSLIGALPIKEAETLANGPAATNDSWDDTTNQQHGMEFLDEHDADADLEGAQFVTAVAAPPQTGASQNDLQLSERAMFGIIDFALNHPEIFDAYYEKYGDEGMTMLASAFDWGYTLEFGRDAYWFTDWDVQFGGVIVIDADDNWLPTGDQTPLSNAIVLERALRDGMKPRPATILSIGLPPKIRPPKEGGFGVGVGLTWAGLKNSEAFRNVGVNSEHFFRSVRDDVIEATVLELVAHGNAVASLAVVVKRVRALRKITKGKWGTEIEYASGRKRAIDHIKDGHFFDARPGQLSSRCSEANSTTKRVKQLVDDAIAKGKHTTNSRGDYSVIHTFDDVIGSDIDGTKTKAVQIFLDELGNVLNAYPISLP